MGHELDASFSRHKSPEDKANRVSFNRDVVEQQRYAPKSPHPQRKGDGNSKSPYLGRKEYKHDSQHHKHGENEPKSPYLQRREFKDAPKSPHFQKKFDFTNRESTQKQKNNSDSFKPSNPQRRNTEKTKTDNQKFPVPRKSDDPSAPKPQRINKRSDKSKGFSSQPKETTENSMTENNGLANNLSAEESARNVLNGDQSHGNIKKDVPGDSVTNIDSETGSRRDSDASKFIDDSEAAIQISPVSSEGPESENVSENEPKLNPVDTETITAAKSIGDNENVKDKMPEVADAVKDEMIIENENEKDTSKGMDDMNEGKTTEVPPDNELKYEDNLIEPESIDNVEKSEEEKIAKVSLQPEESVEQVPQIQQNSEESKEKKVETVEQDLKVDEAKDEVPLKPEGIQNDVVPSNTEEIANLKKSEKIVETAGIELEVEGTKDELSSKPEEAGIEIPKAQDSSHSKELIEEITTAENEVKIDETKDAITPKPEEPAPLNNDVNEIVKESEDKGSLVV